MVLAQIVLILLHGPSGHEIRLNPRAITSLHSAIPGEENKHFTAGVNCMVNTSDGKFVTVVESCEAISRAIIQGRKP